MPWRVDFTRRAERELSTLPRRDREAVTRAIDRLTVDFGAADVSKLAARKGRWRLRVGRWRVILELDNEGGLITVTGVLARKDAY